MSEVAPTFSQMLAMCVLIVGTAPTASYCTGYSATVDRPTVYARKISRAAVIVAILNASYARKAFHPRPSPVSEVTNRAARAYCAFDGRTEVTSDDVGKAPSQGSEYRAQ